MNNRIYKFRAWDKKQKEMFYSDDVEFSAPEDMDGNSYQLSEFFSRISGENSKDNYEVMQYTGIKDKNEKNIYEGDIVTYNMTGWDEEINEEYNNQFKGIVEYNYDKFSIKYRESKLSKCFHELGIARESRIIGNILKNLKSN